MGRPAMRVAGVELPASVRVFPPGQRVISYIPTRDYQDRPYGGWDGSWTALDFAPKTLTGAKLGADLWLSEEGLDPDLVIAAITRAVAKVAGMMIRSDVVADRRPTMEVTAGPAPGGATLRLSVFTWPAVEGVTVPEPERHDYGGRP